MSFELLVGLAGLLGLLFLIALRIPIAYAMIVTGGIGVTILNGPLIFMSQLKDLAYIQFSIYDLSVVPMFVLMGNLATKAGLSRELFQAANAWVGWVRGGVAMSAIIACAGFGAVCGSSLATASTMGKVALPELRNYKYSGSLATGTLAAGGVLGILIPPSVVLVVYAIIVEANIIAMFMAAMIPGLLAVGLFLVTIAIYVRFFPESGPSREPMDLSHQRPRSLAVASPAQVLLSALMVNALRLFAKERGKQSGADVLHPRAVMHAIVRKLIADQ